MTLVDKARTAAYLSVPLFLAAILAVLWPLRSAGGPIVQRVAATLDSANQLIAKGNVTLDAINAPCTSFHGSATCGPIAQLSQTEKNVGILAGQGALQVRQSGMLVAAAADSITTVSSHLDAAVDQIGGTAHSATASLDAGRSYFQAAQPKVDQMLDNLNVVGGRAGYSMDLFNARLADPNLALLIKNSADISGSGSHMLQTADKVETKLASCTLHPTFACQARAYTLFGAQVGGYLVQALPK